MSLCCNFWVLKLNAVVYFWAQISSKCCNFWAWKLKIFLAISAPLLHIFTAGGLFSKCKNKTYNCLLIICKQLNKSLYVSLWVVIFYSLFLTIFDNFWQFFWDYYFDLNFPDHILSIWKLSSKYMATSWFTIPSEPSSPI